ncbi:MAG: hypothetical protein UR96_C0029G0003 [candidate division WS6 bacterium GW2011_GWC1_36_11]|uniref:Uncharacterized protein n=1 Tax=candidate division WS6 bacterium GW2011_GWC1_36_11 TaxID=1619090 RepID=A0A0G0DBL3_9BACT|nr:MAG: hypothetical protein UR96_C0029G0003 [candidate division WS6 bacterium GW2011_GWC1_36_11]HAM96612.1 hypothetical protein [Patescibacteria group bacterium]
MDLINEEISAQSLEEGMQDIALMKVAYAECITNIPEDTYRFVQLNGRRTAEDFNIYYNPVDDICLPDCKRYAQSMNLYIHRDQSGSGIFLLNKMPKKNALGRPDSAVSCGKNIYWWGVFDMGNNNIYSATKKMKKSVPVLSLSMEEIWMGQMIIQLAKATFVIDSPFVLNTYCGKLT